MNFNKIPETDEIKKSKAICPLCYGNGDIPVENKTTGVWEMMPCPKCAEILPKINAKSAEIVEEKTPPAVSPKEEDGKVRMDLLLADMPEQIEEMAKVMTFGLKKYPVHMGWATRTVQQYKAAIARHINAFYKGELIDPDSNCSHLAHVAVNAMFMDYLTRTNNAKSV